jgi:hypothetical protein
LCCDACAQLCDQVIAISEYRASLFEYLKNRMGAIAPNLTGQSLALSRNDRTAQHNTRSRTALHCSAGGWGWGCRREDENKKQWNYRLNAVLTRNL